MRRYVVALGAAATAIGACGGGAPQVLPSTSERASGQSHLMDTTLAGQNCSAKSHTRPFVVEWDATDASTFQARTGTDVVFVRYEGCKLEVLEGCRPEVPHDFGSYRPVDWTTGSLESIEITNEGDLYAKLPLGVASLGARVHGGETFKMEYYVSGTVSATREEVTRAELAKVPACKGATHFVYGFNLGAFALGSTKDLKFDTNGSAYGFGAGVSGSKSRKADKRGGELSRCKAESMKEVLECHAPIRLTLRELSEGEDPKLRAAKATETPSAASLAGQLKAENDQEKEASARYQDATRKMLAGDGKGCLADLDQHDRLDPRPDGLTTNPRAQAAGLRAQCIMLSGQCDAGKLLLRKMEETYMQGMPPAVIDQAVERVASEKCQGGRRSERDELLNAWHRLQLGASSVAQCDEAYATVKRLRPVVKPKDEQDVAVGTITKFPADVVSGCYLRHDDCKKAWEVYRVEEGTRLRRDYPTSRSDDATLRLGWDARNAKCRGK